MTDKPYQISRREFAAALGALLHAAPVVGAPGPARYNLPLDSDWSFAGKTINLPHCVVNLSWQDWDPAAWANVYEYRRRFSTPREFQNRRVILEFDRVMVGASPSINGHALPEHLGGYLPFRYEITPWLKSVENELLVSVDSRWKNVPPQGSPKGPVSVDYLEPGGIIASVRLTAVPQAYIADVFAKPVRVLDAGRHLDVKCTIDAAVAGEPIQLKCELRDGARIIAVAQQTLKPDAPGKNEVSLTLSKLGNIALWHTDSPRLYDVVTTLSVKGAPIHDHRARIGFREARFDVDGFFLNGQKFQLFGLDRHEIYPYVGAAMPPRVLRRDAEILRRDFNCNIVRCSHYPQTEAFLDRCDELGLMVWEEIPGWQYLGNAEWKELAVRDTREMVMRDRNHAAIVIWGVRINESANDQPLYHQTTDLAHSLDDSRPVSGSMTPSSSRNWQQEWHEDVFAFDDYHSAADGTVGINEPLPGVPYMLAEAVGQFNYTKKRVFDAKYRRIADVDLQVAQAIRHAQAHDRAAAFPRMAGVIAWCAFDYGSLINAARAVKTPGIADVFRIPKLGASFYLAQVSPQVRAVIEPDFYWDFGPEMNGGPGKNAAIFSNCDRLEIFLNGKKTADLTPDHAGYPHLKYPPFFCDLTVDGTSNPELRIDGLVDGKRALTRSFSSDRSKDQLFLAADDAEILGDGADATRLVFKVVDRHGALRPFAKGEVAFELAGPATIVGDNPFQLADSGGVGAIWIRSAPKSSGLVRLTATHSQLGKKSVEIRVRS